MVCIIIAAWNSRDLLEHCILHLRKNTTYNRHSLWIVDNASSDGTSDFVQDEVPEANLIRLNQNKGLVYAFNQVAGGVDADYYIRLDTDAFVQKGWLEPLVEESERSDTIGFASSKFVYPDGNINWAGARFSRALGVRVIGHGERDIGQYDKQQEVPFAHGMFLVRREVIDTIGLMDEGYSLGYFEEFDYQLRARRKGFRALYVPRSVIVHATSQTWRKRSPAEKIELFNRNWFRLMAIHWPLHWMLFRIPAEVGRIIREMGKTQTMGPYLAAGIETLKSLDELVAERRKVGMLGRQSLIVTFGKAGFPTSQETLRPK